MSRLGWPIVLAVALLLAPYASSAGNQACPAKLRLRSAMVAPDDVPSGWAPTLSATTPLWLSGVSVYDGPPEEEASLVPDDPEAEPATWTFEGKLERGKWISCDYGDGLVHLATRVDDDTSSCTAVVRSQGDPSVVSASFSCQKGGAPSSPMGVPPALPGRQEQFDSSWMPDSLS